MTLLFNSEVIQFVAILILIIVTIIGVINLVRISVNIIKEVLNDRD